MQWTYQLVKSTVLTNDQLDEQGAKGWELVSVVPTSVHDHYDYYFKRSATDSNVEL